MEACQDKNRAADLFSRSKCRTKFQAGRVGRAFDCFLGRRLYRPGRQRTAGRKDSAYRSGRSPDWIKMKNPSAPAVKREAEEDWGR
jgi:hypothetical protein